MGREAACAGPFGRFDVAKAPTPSRARRWRKIGIDVRDPTQAVGTLSGGERQCVAIARAVYFGAKVLILDEPTSALGVKQASVVLKYVAQARARGLGVIFITHNVHHAWAVGDKFTVLNRGRTFGTFAKDEITREAAAQHDGGRQGARGAGGGARGVLPLRRRQGQRAAIRASRRVPPPSTPWPRRCARTAGARAGPSRGPRRLWRGGQACRHRRTNFGRGRRACGGSGSWSPASPA